MNNNTINVLLIDDNPEYAFCQKRKVPDLPNQIQEETQVTELPWVSRQAHAETFTIKDRLEGVESFFKLKWLQFHPDVFEFRNLSLEVKLKYGLHKLAEIGFIPDLIVFDYALTDNSQENPSAYLHYLENEIINSFINPNRPLANFLSMNENRNILLPRNSGYHDSSPINQHNVNFDSYGLYCGSMVSEMFKYETPIAAIPVTRKSKITIKSEPDPDFFEWFINSSYHKVFDRNHRTKKDWDSILNDGLNVYRKEIINMISNGKIQVDLINLIRLLNGEFSKTTKDIRGIQYFCFTTLYGKRSIPLDGLFIDFSLELNYKKPNELLYLLNYLNSQIELTKAEILKLNARKIISEKDKSKIDNEISKSTKRFETYKKQVAIFNNICERDFEIWKFSKEIIDTIINSSKTGLNTSELLNVMDNTNSLMSVFDSVDFKKRILLSYYHDKVNKQGRSSLTSNEEAIYNECLKLYTLKDDKIDKPEEYSLSAIGSKGKGANPVINRLTVYFVAIRLWERYSSYISSLNDDSTNSNTPSEQSLIAINPPKVLDLLLALFPIWTDHVVLFKDDSTMEKKPSDSMSRRLKTLTGFTHGSINDDNGIDLRKQMTLGEYMIAKSFAVSFNVDLPIWLKNYTDEA